ncbi:gliding motility-associated C-terminal domain-containing protein [bacterium]|nr:gliding motility-associated C-terminal domain-containing protein [bacterium]
MKILNFFLVCAAICFSFSIGGSEILNPTDLTITVTMDSLSCFGSAVTPNPFTVHASVFNPDPWVYNSIYVYIEFDCSCMTVVEGVNPRSLGTLYPGVTRSAEWDVEISPGCAGDTVEFTVSVGGISALMNSDILLLDSPDGFSHMALDIGGYDYTIANIAAFDSIDFYDYGILFVGWHMSDATHNALLSREDDIEDWWRDGGRILVTGQLRTGRFDWVPLAVEDSGFNYDINIVYDTDHFIISGWDGPGGSNDLTSDRLSHWNISCHSYFTSWHYRYQVLTVFQPMPAFATFLVADYGCDGDEGRIILSGQDFDYHVAYPSQPEPGATWADTLMHRCFDFLNYADCGSEMDGLIVIPYCECVGAEAVLIDPVPENAFVACLDQGVDIRIFTDVPLDSSTITMYINSDTMVYPENMRFYGDTLRFSPSSHWSHGDTVDFGLIRADDTTGCPFVRNVISSFIVDLLPPEITNTIPPNDTIINDSVTEISFSVYDDISGVDMASIIVEINGIEYSASDSGVTLDGNTWRFNPDSIGLFFPNAETVSVCVTFLADNVPSEYCGPNAIPEPFCWYFFLDYENPAAEFVLPELGTYSACSDQRIILIVTDASPIDTLSIQLQVNEDVFDIGSPYLSFNGDSIVFSPPAGYWEGTDTVHTALLSIGDIYGNSLTSPLVSYFYLDFYPPAITGISPFPGEVIHIASPEFSFQISDSGSGLDPTRLIFSVGEMAFFTRNPAVTWDEPNFTLSCDSLGLAFEDGDTAQLCIHGEDSPDYCSANEIDTCYEVYISLDGPIAERLYPARNYTVSCSVLSVIYQIIDPDGVDPGTILLRVNDDTLSTASEELTWSGDSLVYTPSEPFENGDTLLVSILQADDIYGNPLQNHPSVRIIFDLTDPVIRVNNLDGRVVSDSMQRISLSFIDSISGISDSIEYFSINGVEYSTSYPIISWDTLGLPVLTLTFYPPESLRFAHNETVTVCIGIYDNARICPPNFGEFCFDFYVDLRGPTADLQRPFSGAYSSCNDQQILISVQDCEVPHGVEPDSILLIINDVGYTVDGSAYLAWYNDTLAFSPYPGFWADEDTVTIALYAQDSLGNPADSVYRWWFVMDLAPPYMYGNWPTIAETVSTTSPFITFDVADLFSGVVYDSVYITVNSTVFTLESAAFSYTDPGYIYNSSLSPVVFIGGDRVEICVIARDQPDLCSPNVLDTCWHFFIASGGPVVTGYYPAESTFSACENQNIVIIIEDLDGINTSTVNLEINDSLYTIDETELEFRNDSLIFTPSSAWDVTQVRVQLTAVEDSLGNPMEEPSFGWVFFMDTEPPEISGISPLPADTVDMLCPTVEFSISDDMSGLNAPELRMQLDTLTFDLTSPYVLWIGDTVSFDVCDFGFFLRGGDSISVCVHAEDQPDYCGPNTTDTCWILYIASGGPVARVLEPMNGAISACDSQLVIISIYDSDGIDPASIVLELNGVEYTVGDEALSFLDTLLTFNAPTLWSDGDTVYVELLSASDRLGNALETPLSFSFVLDLSPPVFRAESPINGVTISEITPTISCSLFDAVSGVDSLSIVITVNGETYSVEETLHAFDHDGWLLSFYPDSAGLRFTGGDTVEVCMQAGDTPDYCSPNVAEYCWEFYISGEGPVVEIITPAPETYTACDDQELQMLILDGEGIDPATIQLLVEGTVYTISDSNLIFEDSILSFYSPVLFGNGDTVDVSLLSVEDIIGNPLGSPVSWRFYVDLTPPVAWDLLPLDGDTVDTVIPTITARLADSISGLNEVLIWLEVNGVRYSLDSTGVSWDGELLSFDPAEAGLAWSGGYDIDICLHAVDQPDYCPPHTFDTCWSFSIFSVGPTIELLIPLDNTVSSCDDQEIRFVIVTEHDIDTASIQLELNDTVYAVDGDWLYLESDTLVFSPLPGFWEGIDSVDAALLNFSDTLGNVASPLPIAWRFFMDLEGPLASNFIPAEGDTVFLPQVPVSVDIYDSFLRLDTTSLLLSIEGICFVDHAVVFGLGDPALSWDGFTLTFEPALADDIALGVEYPPSLDSLRGTGIYFCEADPICVTLEANDIPPDYCEPNFIEEPYRWCFHFVDTVTIDSTVPIVELLSPETGAVSSCLDQEIIIRIYDEHGIYPSSIVISIGGVEYTIADSILSFIDETLLVFSPVEALFENGEVVDVVLEYVEDTRGNGITAPYHWTFHIDHQPPLVNLDYPLREGRLEGDIPTFIFDITDNLAGIDPDLVWLRLNGIDFEIGDLGVSWFFNDADSAQLHFNPTDAGLIFSAEDSMHFVIGVGDDAEYCGANEDIYEYNFIVMGTYSCGVHPNPFTPNGDEVNDYVILDYPGMFNNKGILRIFNLRGIKVADRNIGPIANIAQFVNRSWDGKDNTGLQLPEGIYMYIIEVKGKVVCDGTLVIVR